MLGSDGHSASCKGRATVVRVIPSGSGYDFAQDWANPLCGSTAQGRGGFAGSFASDGETAYWVDTAGALWAHNLANGAPRWPAHPTGLSLAALLGGVEAFTNTEPAIDLSSGLVYVTLRNFRLPGDSFSLQGGTHSYQGETLHAPGAPGALVAIDRATGTKKWQHIFRPQGSDPLWDYPAINTAPLVIRTRGVVVVGDAMGFIHAFDLGTGADATLFINSNCTAQSTLDLKKSGERPMRSGQASWSQVSGVGVDPAFGNRLLLMGVNVFREGQGTQSFGRMAAIRAGDPYNLRWTDAQLDTGPRLKPDEPATFRGTVTMDLATQPLGAMRDGHPAEIAWFVVDDDGYQRRLPGSATLPESLTANVTAPTELSFTLTEKDPAKGYIMGVIDPATIVLHGAGALQDAGLQAAAVAGELTPQCQSGHRNSAEVVLSTDESQLNYAFADNTIKLPYELSQPLDLAVVLEAPATVDYRPDGRYPVTIRMRNLSNTAVDRPGAMQETRLESTSLGSQTLSRRPLLFDPFQERVNMIQVPMGACGSRSVVRVELNAANEPPETDRSNNVAQVLTIVGPCSPTGGSSSSGGTFVGGEGRTIIVPPDCIPNPDLTDPRVCTNYDKTLDDW